MPTPMNRRAALGILSAAPLAVADALRPQAAAAQELTVLRVGAIPIDPCGELFYGLDFGAFKKAGLDVQLQMMRNGATIAAAIVGGSLDLGLCDLVAASAGHSRGLPFTYVVSAAVYTPEAPGHALLVKKTSAIRTAKEFEGKTIATGGLHGIDHVTTQAWLDKNGADWKAVKFTEIPYPSMTAALDADTVDAMVITEPFWSLTEGRFRGFELGDGGVANRFLISGYIATTDWAKKNTDVARKFATVVRDMGRWGNANHAASAAIMAKYTKLAPDVLAKMERSYYGDRLTPALLQPLIEAGVKYGSVPKSFPGGELIFAPSA